MFQPRRTRNLKSQIVPHRPEWNTILASPIAMEAICTFDPLASPAHSTAGPATQDESSADEATGLDLARLENVYRALMSTLLDTQQATPPKTDEPPKEVDVGNADEGIDVPKNAKRRKMDKKKAKREEQKRMAEETVDVVGPSIGRPFRMITLIFFCRVQALFAEARQADLAPSVGRSNLDHSVRISVVLSDFRD